MASGSQAASEGGEPTASEGRVQFEKSFDLVGHAQASRQQPRSTRLFTSLVISALTLTRRASPRISIANAALQLGGALLLLLQVVFAKLALEAILEQSAGGREFSEVVLPLAGLVAATGLAGLALAAQAQLQKLLGETVQKRMLESVLDVTTSVPLETFESPVFHDDLQRVRVNAAMQPLNLSQALVSIFGGVIGVLALTVTLLLIEPLLVPVLLVTAVPQALLTRRGGSLEFQFRVRETPTVRVREYLLEALSGRDEAKEIRAFDLGRVLFSRWDQTYRAYLSRLRTHVFQRVRLAVITSLFTFAGTGISLGLLVWLVLDERISLASAGAALVAIRLLAGRMELLLSGVGMLFECSLFLRDHNNFMLRKPTSDGATSETRGARVEPFTELRVEDVHFRYPETDRDVLHGISIQIRAGEVVALVGENGSGKTTLAKILGHVFTPTRGRILWDGTDSAELSAPEVRRNIGVIFQDFVRYQLSAHENIGLGRAEAMENTDEIVEAARRGGADPYLRQLPDGYDTLLGKSFWGGYDLSVGQWQRVAISRAFFRQADFLVLDEPTASLDARSERRLFEQMGELVEGRTLLLISHRFATVRSADRIFVMHEGEIIEEGSHDELMELGGRYAELFEIQAASYR